MRSVFAQTITEEEEVEAEGSQRWFGRTKGLAIPPWIPCILLFGMLDRQCCAYVWGKDLEQVCNW